MVPYHVCLLLMVLLVHFAASSGFAISCKDAHDKAQLHQRAVAHEHRLKQPMLRLVQHEHGKHCLDVPPTHSWSSMRSF